jgi:quaternary ammonium compound-resistance protein SugE
MAWFLLFLAGGLEVVWALGLKFTDGFSRPLPSVLVGLAMVGSMMLLGRATQTIPVGTAYALWVGIGVLGTVIGAAVFFDEALTLSRVVFVGLLLASIIGLKVTAP